MGTKTIRLLVRQAQLADIPAITQMAQGVYGKLAMTEEMLAGQISIFPEGQFIAEYNGNIVGHCATFIIDGEVALSAHSWAQITGHGFASRHNPDGDYLYGMEVCVHPDYRRLRIGQRLYNARKKLCQDMRLKGIVFGGRIPSLRKKIKQYSTPEEYFTAITKGAAKDPVVAFQTRNGFEVLGLLPKYLPYDQDSMGYATHMLWKNPRWEEPLYKERRQRGRVQESVRIAAVQYQVRKVHSFDDFARQIEYFVDVAADYQSDFICFPEMLTIPLLSMEKKRLTHQESIEKITTYTGEYTALMQRLAVSYNTNIIGGTHPTRMDDGSIENHAYVFLRSGETYSQPKIHPTPNERFWWNIKGGSRLRTIPTDCGPIGVLVCYDSEFPEPVRYLTDQGTKILFVPFCTDERQSYLRVRYCCQARAVENQIYVVAAGIVGNLPDVENMDVHYAESSIFTPCDFPFARDGIAATAAPNTEMLIFADLKLDQLTMARNSGTVQNLKDRRFDLYRVEWKVPESEATPLGKPAKKGAAG